MQRLWLFALVVLAPALTRQQPPPAFRASVEAVSLDVSVLDAHRHPVVGLKAEDFSILEDGRPRPIVAFAAVDVPAPVIAASPSTPDIPVAGGQASASASLTSLADTRGRLIGLIVPSHHFFERLRGAFEGIAMTVVERMSDGDVATVIVPGTPATPLTSDRAALLTAIHSRPDVDTASCDPVLLNAIADFAERVGPLSTRRKLLFFIGGMIALTTRDACAASVNAARARMFHALRLSNVSVYTLDPSGLETLAKDATVHSPQGFRSNGPLDRTGVMQAT